MTRSRSKASKDKHQTKTSENKPSQNRFSSDHRQTIANNANNASSPDTSLANLDSRKAKQHNDSSSNQNVEQQDSKHSVDANLNIPNQSTSTTNSTSKNDDSQSVESSITNESVHYSNKKEDASLLSPQASMNSSQQVQQTGPMQQEEPQSSAIHKSEHSIDDLFEIEPPRLTRLVTINGSHVYIVGTAHFSQDSVNDVSKIIRFIKPQAVVVELCRERMALLTLSENENMEGNKNFSIKSLPSLMSKQGFAQGLIHAFFLKMSSALTKKLDICPGGEFRVAFAESKNVPGCTVYLGDRSIQITIARAVNSLTFWEKVKFLYQAMSIDSFQITQEEIEKFKSKDILETLIGELGDEFEGIKSVILDERDIYLAHSIYGIAERYGSIDPKSNIVAVVGIGHVSGIVQNWGKTTDEQVCLISEIPEPSKTKIVMLKLIKYSFLGLCCYGLYRGFSRLPVKFNK